VVLILFFPIFVRAFIDFLKHRLNPRKKPRKKACKQWERNDTGRPDQP